MPSTLKRLVVFTYLTNTTNIKKIEGHLSRVRRHLTFVAAVEGRRKRKRMEDARTIAASSKQK
eukprot:scaffold2707_cov273-Chaetoceros_neogracile.AAC.4